VTSCTIVPVFVDTNVLVYARDAGEAVKQPKAHAWLGHLWRSREGRLSQQVLAEFYVTVTRKLNPGLTSAEARAEVRTMLTWQPVLTDEDLVDLGPRHVSDRTHVVHRVGFGDLRFECTSVDLDGLAVLRIGVGMQLGVAVIVEGVAAHQVGKPLRGHVVAHVRVSHAGRCPERAGARGGRVRAIVEELNQEKIDIITWSEEPAEFVANATRLPEHFQKARTWLESLDLLLMAEANVVLQRFDGAGEDRVWLTSYLGATWFPVQGVMGTLAGEHHDPDLAVERTQRSSLLLQLHYFATEHWAWYHRFWSKKVFGGLAFPIIANMAVGVSGQGGIMVRVEPAETGALVAKPNARPFEMGGREMRAGRASTPRNYVRSASSSRACAEASRTRVRFRRSVSSPLLTALRGALSAAGSQQPGASAARSRAPDPTSPEGSVLDKGPIRAPRQDTSVRCSRPWHNPAARP
jgi:predicted nucleic acid-binding protein